MTEQVFPERSEGVVPPPAETALTEGQKDGNGSPDDTAVEARQDIGKSAALASSDKAGRTQEPSSSAASSNPITSTLVSSGHHFNSSIQSIASLLGIGAWLTLFTSVLNVTGWLALSLVILGGCGALLAIWTWRRSRRRAVVAGATAALSLLGIFLIAPTSEEPPPAPPLPQPDYLAYTTQDGVYLATPGQTKVDRLKALLGGDLIRGLTWSTDGRYVAGTLYRRDAVTKVWAYDTLEKHAVEWPECDCKDAYFVGTDLLAVQDTKLAVLSLNFKTPRLVEPADLDLRKARVLGSTVDGLIVALPDPAGTAAYGGPENIHVVRPDGSQSRLYGTASNKAVLLWALRSDGDYIAWKTGWRNGYCQDYEYARAFRTANASTYEPDSPDPEQAWAVVSLKWSRVIRPDRDEWVIYSVQIPSRHEGADCREGEPQLLRSTPGGSWEPVATPRGIIEGSASASGVLAVRLGRYGDEKGKLLFMRDDTRFPVDEGVIETAWSR